MAALIRILAIAASAFVAVGFMAFVANRSEEGSDNQVKSIDGSRVQPAADVDIDRPSPPADVERRRERRNGDLRETIDDANDYLLAPFTFVESENVWVERLASTALGLLAYGLGGLLLANFIPRHRREHHGWQEATP